MAKNSLDEKSDKIIINLKIEKDLTLNKVEREVLTMPKEVSAKMLKNRNHILNEKARGAYFKDPYFVRDMFIQMVDFNKDLISKIEELEKEVAELKGEATPTKN